MAATDGGGEETPLNLVLQRVQKAAERSGRNVEEIRVVAASKTKAVSALRHVYDAGHRSFGENYVQELLQKAPQLPDDIEWHYIGNLQSNKVKPLISGVPNLAYVETVDDEKIANLLDHAVEKIGRKPLKVFVQVNTSGETCKFHWTDLATNSLSTQNLVLNQFSVWTLQNILQTAQTLSSVA